MRRLQVTQRDKADQPPGLSRRLVGECGVFFLCVVWERSVTVYRVSDDGFQMLRLASPYITQIDLVVKAIFSEILLIHLRLGVLFHTGHGSRFVIIKDYSAAMSLCCISRTERTANTTVYAAQASKKGASSSVICGLFARMPRLSRE